MSAGSEKWSFFFNEYFDGLGMFRFRSECLEVL